MPNLNIKDEPKKSFKRQPLSPFRRPPLSGGGGTTLHVMIVLGIIILIAVGVYLANDFGYIHLWTKKTPVPAVVAQQQESELLTSVDSIAAAQPVPVPSTPEPKKTTVAKKSEVKAEKKPEVKVEKKPEVKVEKKPEVKVEKKSEVKAEKKLEVIAEKKLEIKAETKKVDKILESTIGEYSIIIGSFRDRSKAEAEASKWKEVGYISTVSEKANWYRLAIGKYATKKEALENAKKLADGFEGGYWIEQVK
jgi:cell division protein FtsN